jgi:two-component sensor histidine kinase
MRLQQEKREHQQTRKDLNTAKMHLQKEVVTHQQTEQKVRHLTQLLQQEITLHTHIKAQQDTQKMLLKEIHHRVKNNMTMAISFIQLQMGQLYDQRDLALFQELEHRIYTMALLHEKLYTSQDASSVNLRIFLTDLSQSLLSSYALHPGQISLRIDVEEVSLTLDKAIPCGLICNEILTNALKYAFPDGRQGTILVKGQKRHDTYVLIIQDDGVGLPEGVDIKTITSLGMRLVSMLAQNMGNMRIGERTQGTSFIIEFSTDVMNTEM